MTHTSSSIPSREEVGNTPLVRLTTMSAHYGFNVFAKLEMLNLGGSMKDRPAYYMVEQALAEGLLKPGGTVIESSSGNMGIGLAQACLRRGLAFICVVDARTSATNVRIMQAYGARVEVVKESLTPKGSLLEARLAKVQELLAATPGSYWPNQYANPANPRSHETTMHEIAIALKNEVDYLFCATGTCGTIRGCADYVKEQRLKTHIYAVDAEGSVIFGGKAQPRLIPGHGSAIRPAIYRPNMAAQIVRVSDKDCLQGCQTLLRQEAIFAGGSSGAVISALAKVASDIPPEATVVVVLPDRGERYLDTIYDKTWVEHHFGRPPVTEEKV